MCNEGFVFDSLAREAPCANEDVSDSATPAAFRRDAALAPPDESAPLTSLLAHEIIRLAREATRLHQEIAGGVAFESDIAGERLTLSLDVADEKSWARWMAAEEGEAA